MGYGGGGMIGFDFEPYGHHTVEEADRLIHKECFEEQCSQTRQEIISHYGRVW